MRVSDFREKRRFKRLDLSLPMRLMSVSSDGKEEFADAVTANVSYNGAYVTGVNIKDIKPKDNLHISLLVPRDYTRDFPFSRLVGKAKVVRVEEDGLALDFSEGISRLRVAN